MVLDIMSSSSLIQGTGLSPRDSFPKGLAQLIESSKSSSSLSNGEPSAKRRKLDSGSRESCSSESHPILLHRLQLKLSFSSGSGASPIDDVPTDEHLAPFVIKSFDQLAYSSVRDYYEIQSTSEDADSDVSRAGHHPASTDDINAFRIQYLNDQSKTEDFSIRVSQESADLEDLDILEAALPFQKTSSSKKLCKAEFAVTGTSATTCIIQLDIRWVDSEFYSEITLDKQQLKLLALIAPALAHAPASAWSPRDFYDSVYVPDRDDKTAEDLEVPDIQSVLFGYQKRTVQWMLKREGVNIHGKPLTSAMRSSRVPHGWTPLRSFDNQQIYVNPWLGLVTTHESLMNDPYTEVSGGILAEEMGLGKTVEIIALLVRHRRDMESTKHPSPPGLPAIKATLIIAPESIINQWAAEINLHAPSLKTLRYPGVKKGGKKKEKELLTDIKAADIVLCSYNTLAGEVHFARDPPQRNTRHKRAVQHERLRSPLVEVHWWRCVLDECQMIQSGVSSAAEVALQIPRQHAWAVSGTPLRKDPGDVYGLLRFLKLYPYAWSSKIWTRLLDDYQHIFKELIKRITLRHTKHLVKDEIELPPQKRVVSTVSLTQIEEQHYSNTFDRMCQRIGLSREGGPLQEDWNPNDPYVIEQMRTWLTRLRQLCLHPDVSGRNNRALGGRAHDVLRTVTDVLDMMVEQNEVALRTDERSFFMSRLRRGQLLEHGQKSQDALAVWQDALIKIQESVMDSRAAVEKAVLEDKSEDETWSPESAARNNRLGQLRNRLKLALELEHMAEFFIGNAYFQIKDNKDVTAPDSEEFQRLEKLEVSQYDAAKAIRIELLVESQEKVQGLITELMNYPRWKLDSPETDRGFPNVLERGGIESGAIFDDLGRLAEQYNRLMNQVLEWRSKLVEMLCKPLVDYAAEDNQGDEYEKSTKEQDEVYARMDVFRAAVTDLSEVLTSYQNTLIKNEASGWAKLAREGKGHAPETMLELLKVREALKPVSNLGSIHGLLARLRSVKNNFHQGDSRRKLEAVMMEKVEKSFRRSLNDQELIEKWLKRDVNAFIDIQNSRLEFYRQLQHISDLVAPWPGPEGIDGENSKSKDLTPEQQEAKLQKQIEQAWKKVEADETQLQASIQKKSSQARYLEHLKHASTLGDERKCIICQDDNYEIGVLTPCGHLFCKDCMNAWLSSHAKCPQCRATIKFRSELYQITYKPQELRMEEEVTSGSSDQVDDEQSRENSPKLTSIYSQISVGQLNQIKSIDLLQNFGTKIDFIARHIIWLRISDPGCKTVVFSQFRKFCPGQLSQAFDRLGIRYAIVGGKIGVDRFKHDPNIECLLMHAGSQASGMNLVNASHVLLCEPLVNTALELQAIARVHRIGQHRPTTVWMYLIEGTVEKAIYDLSVERRLEHIGNQKKQKSSGTSTPKRLDEDIQAADAEEMNDKPLTTLLSKNEQGEIVGKDDLWQCLFGNTQQPRRELPDLGLEG